MMPLDMRRQFYAEEIAAISNVRSAAVIDALATVPRERFLPPGPWTVRGEADFLAASRRTADSDPRHVYHNYAIAIDEGRQLFNGAPGLLSMLIDRLELKPGDRAMHVGAGTGYYTAILAQCVGSQGRVAGLEVDEALATEARANLSSMPWVDVRRGDATNIDDEPFDAILVNAGVTHPLDGWLRALAENGRIILPLTVAMNSQIGKGLLVLATRLAGDASFDARVLGFVAIYNAVGLRDDAVAKQLGAALARNPFPPLKHLRRDSHEAGASCWMHGSGWCLSTD